eukprot:gene2473-5403_t
METTSTPEAPLRIRVVYAKKTHEMTIDREKTISELKKEIEKETGCSVSQMKLMHKGLLSSPSSTEGDLRLLKDVKLADNAKILVVGATTSQIEEVVSAEKSSSSPAFLAQANAMATKKKLSEEKPHIDIIKKGPPADVMLGYRPGQEPLPEGPLTGLIGEGGKKARLHIRVAQNKLIIHYPNTSRELLHLNRLLSNYGKVFHGCSLSSYFCDLNNNRHSNPVQLSLSTVQRVSSEPIPGHEEYLIVGFKVGRKTTLYLYWVPAQYLSAIKGAMFGSAY